MAGWRSRDSADRGPAPAHTRSHDRIGGWARSHSLGLAGLKVWEGINAEDMPWARVANAATRTPGAVGSIGLVLVLVLGVYLAADPHLYRGLVRLVPPAWRVRVDGALLASAQALSRSLPGQGISMLLVGSATAIGLAVLGIPLAVTIGVIAGVLAFVPFFGPIASGILAVLLAFMQGPQQALCVAGICIAIQQVEGNLLMPSVQRWAVSLPAVLGVSAAVIFGLLFGLPGVILATPLMGGADRADREALCRSGTRSGATDSVRSGSSAPISAGNICP